MEGIIKVEPQKLISTAEEFGTTGGQIRTLTEQMVSTVDSLKATWEGEASAAYSTKFHQLEDDMQKMHRMIEEHVRLKRNGSGIHGCREAEYGNC